MVVWSIKLLLFVLSLSGYIYLWSCKDKKIKFEFIPILIISIMSNGLLLFAYVGLLKFFSIVIYIGGLIAFLYIAFNKRDVIKANYSYLLFLIGVITIAFLTYGRLFNEHDSYSHYGIMLKRMLLHGGLPDGTDSVIIFKSYPAAMSCFMYMSCLFNNGADWTMTATQGIVLIACVYALVGVIKSNKTLSCIYIALVGYGMIFYCNFITSLMLDTIIPLLGGVAFLIYFEYREDLKSYFPYIAIILSFCVLTKNSGFAFVVALAIVILIFEKSCKVKSTIYTVLIPGIMYFLWTVHVKVAFPGGMESNHAMSVKHYADVYSSRSEEMIKAICISFYDRMFNRPNPGFHILKIFILAIIVLYISKQSKIKDTIHIIGSVLISYVIWMAGTLGMYIFSMEDTKPSILECFERYRSSGEMFCVFLISFMVISQISCLQPSKYLQMIKGIHITILPEKKTANKESDKEKCKENIRLVVALASFVLLVVSVAPLWTNKHIGERTGISTEYREAISEIIGDKKLDADLSYLIYGEDDFDYRVIEGNMLSPFRPFFTVQYELNSRKIVFANSETFLTWVDKQQYDVVIFLKEDEISTLYKQTNGYSLSDKIICKE